MTDNIKPIVNQDKKGSEKYLPRFNLEAKMTFRKKLVSNIIHIHLHNTYEISYNMFNKLISLLIIRSYMM